MLLITHAHKNILLQGTQLEILQCQISLILNLLNDKAMYKYGWDSMEMSYFKDFIKVKVFMRSWLNPIENFFEELVLYIFR